MAPPSFIATSYSLTKSGPVVARTRIYSRYSHELIGSACLDNAARDSRINGCRGVAAIKSFDTPIGLVDGSTRA